jgi:hypothetical protein
MLKIFVSHAAVDADIAGALQGWIRSTFLGSVTVFVSSDARSITPGDDWRAGIEEALRTADIALVVCTETSLGRPWLGFEAGAAWMAGARVVPVCYHGLSVDALPMPFSSRQGLDLGHNDDVNALLSLLITAGGFDHSLVERKPLLLPDRRSLLAERPSLDVRATVVFGWLGSRGRFGSAFADPTPSFIFHCENHGDQPVYLEGGLDILIKEGKGKAMIREFDGMPTLRRDLLPGQSEQLAFRLDDVRLEDVNSWDRAFFRDQIGREFTVDPTSLASAIAEFAQWRKSNPIT